MEVQRLVVEEPERTLTLDFHAGLTVAFHERPAVRARLLDDLVAALGEGRPGLHLELVDHERHNLAVFRPRGGRPRVIDIDAATDVTAQYRSPEGGVDVLGRMGLDRDSVARLIRIGARQLDRLPDTGTDNHRDARRLAGVDQAVLWPAAGRLDRADVALTRAQLALPGCSVADVDAFDRVAAEHGAAEATAARHRPIQRLGWSMATVCLLLGVALLVFDQQVGDNAFTGQVLAGLGLLAALVTVYDGQTVRAARRAERDVVRGAGAETFEQLVARVGPMADPRLRRELVRATEERTVAAAAWQKVAGAVSPVWALRHRVAIEALAAQRSQLHRVGAEHLVSDDSTVADSARLLVDRVIELQEVGTSRERLPLLLDEPFAGCSPSDVQRLLATVLRLSAHHQVVLVSGDRYIQAWATEAAATAGVSFVRLDDVTTASAASTAAEASTAAAASTAPTPTATPSTAPTPSTTPPPGPTPNSSTRAAAAPDPRTSLPLLT